MIDDQSALIWLTRQALVVEVADVKDYSSLVVLRRKRQSEQENKTAFEANNGTRFDLENGIQTRFSVSFPQRTHTHAHARTQARTEW